MLGEAKVDQMLRGYESKADKATGSLVAIGAQMGLILAFPVLSPFIAGVMAAHHGVTASVLIAVGKGILKGKSAGKVAKELGIDLAIAEAVEEGIDAALESD